MVCISHTVEMGCFVYRPDLLALPINRLVKMNRETSLYPPLGPFLGTFSLRIKNIYFYKKTPLVALIKKKGSPLDSVS